MMKKTKLLLVVLSCFMLSGCIALIVGGAVGAVGGYAVSRDTIQGDSDTPYQKLWDTATEVSRMRGAIVLQDQTRGILNLKVDKSKVYIRFIRLTEATTRVRVAARKYHMPDLTLAQDLFVKIIEEAKK